ncbi:MAG: hypothetical protein IID40_07600 [Planctomycetes bacterium]|nr:hypothetical protein [Planctomycetota bacterium]
MKVVPNIGKPVRTAYVVGGVVLAALPFVTSMAGWLGVALPVLGVVMIAAGAVGF